VARNSRFCCSKKWLQPQEELLEKCCSAGTENKRQKAKCSTRYRFAGAAMTLLCMCDNFTLVTLLVMRFFLFFPSHCTRRRALKSMASAPRRGKKVTCVQKKEKKQKRLYPKRNLTASARAFQITPCNCSAIDFTLFASHKKARCHLLRVDLRYLLEAWANYKGRSVTKCFFFPLLYLLAAISPLTICFACKVFGSHTYSKQITNSRR
jgi:hypothetical protein